MLLKYLAFVPLTEPQHLCNIGGTQDPVQRWAIEPQIGNGNILARQPIVQSVNSCPIVVQAELINSAYSAGAKNARNFAPHMGA